MFYMAETEGRGRTLVGGSPCGSNYGTYQPPYGTDPTGPHWWRISERHEGGANTLFFPGNVTWFHLSYFFCESDSEKRDTFWEYENYY